MIWQTTEGKPYKPGSKEQTKFWSRVKKVKESEIGASGEWKLFSHS